ncbi:helix-turn-helix transcriptional regulator [Thermoflavimicrobium daqui]|jgi:transcriptional regulator with XRE-family HTH domain|uniref:HTH cro/C1-type domain-containing protein n=1 Tax=Thermoflavimicrobium daqui TaxID=2137476 RepID=A0A364K1K3_9BACL|nr:helix-turn-helix transcriptional regulator [Thermoflavimicrobium daqui]RAL21909.1 hypothetical protein DL897_15065 [Thermoflavimicrobium daqui]
MGKRRFSIKKYLAQLGWTQATLARKSGVPPQIISKYMIGSKTYTIDYLIDIKETFQKAGLQLNGIEDLFEDEKKDGD